jgi:ABC-type methionine transport system permease subunit
VSLPARVERLSSWKFIVIIVWLTLMALIVMGTVLGLAGAK